MCFEYIGFTGKKVVEIFSNLFENWVVDGTEIRQGFSVRGMIFEILCAEIRGRYVDGIFSETVIPTEFVFGSAVEVFVMFLL